MGAPQGCGLPPRLHNVAMDLESLVDRLGLETGTDRVIVGIAGAPGAGKSTVAAAIVQAARERGVAAALVPMDGFHLADASLQRLGLSDRKGAPETFDGHGYLALLRRVRVDRTTVWAPGFERDLEQPIAGAIAVDPDVRLVVTEGNYLLIDADPWREARSLLDQAWFVEVDDAVGRPEAGEPRSRQILDRPVQGRRAPHTHLEGEDPA